MGILVLRPLKVEGLLIRLNPEPFTLHPKYDFPFYFPLPTYNPNFVAPEQKSHALRDAGFPFTKDRLRWDGLCQT